MSAIHLDHARQEGERLAVGQDEPILPDDDGEDSPVDYTDLLEDPGEDGLDDAEASDLGTGLEVEELDAIVAGDDELFALDADALATPETEESFLGEDATGPRDLDLGEELDDLPPATAEDVPAADDLGALLDDLPPLGALDADDAEGTTDASILLALDDERVTARREPWPVLAVDLPPGPRRAISVVAEGILLCGAALERRDRTGHREELAQPGPGLVGVVATEHGHVVATVTGEILAIEHGRARVVEGWRAAAGIGAERAVDVQLAGNADRILACISSGTLLASSDGGARWEVVPLPGAALALSSAPPHWIAVQDGDVVGLVLDRPGDGAPHGGRGETLAILGRGCFIAARDAVVALGARDRGVAVSTDGGRTFRRVTGLAHVTALAIGTLPGGSQLFAATFSAAGNTATVHRVDLRSLDVFALGEVRGGDEDEDAEVTSLAFDESERALWAVGSFGVRLFGRPD